MWRQEAEGQLQWLQWMEGEWLTKSTDLLGMQAEGEEEDHDWDGRNE